MFEAASQNFALAPSGPRGFKLQNFRPTFGRDHRDPRKRVVPAEPPSPLTPPPPLLIHPWGPHPAPQTWLLGCWGIVL